MRRTARALTGLAAAALAVGMAGRALAAIQARPLDRVPAPATRRPHARPAHQHQVQPGLA
jgi:hypothetical protein